MVHCLYCCTSGLASCPGTCRNWLTGSRRATPRTVEPLALEGAPAFEQDRLPWVTARPGQPGCRPLDGLRVMKLRHAAPSAAAAAALDAIGLAWPPKTGDVTSTKSVLAVRRQSEETVALGPDAPAFDTLLRAAAPGRHADATALDLSHGIAVIELDGPRLDEWLCHLVGARAIPTAAGRASRVRLTDITVLVVRLANDRLWLVVDRSQCLYFATGCPSPTRARSNPPGLLPHGGCTAPCAHHTLPGRFRHRRCSVVGTGLGRGHNHREFALR